MGIDKKWNIMVGMHPTGPNNKISDVAGVTVGHVTLADGGVQTGVTAILPHQGNVFKDSLGFVSPWCGNLSFQPWGSPGHTLWPAAT